MLKIYEALKIALDALDEEEMMYRPDYKLQASKADDAWVFWFIFLPETPGLDVTVIVSEDGTKKILPGI